VFVQGLAAAGETLSADTSLLEGDGEISYTWRRGKSIFAGTLPIEGAEAATYTLTEADNGAYIHVAVRRAGWDGVVRSDAIGAVGDPPITGTVHLRGDVESGYALTADTSALEGGAEHTFIWKRGTAASAIFTPVEGAHSSVYLLSDADKGKYLTVSVNCAGFSGWITSAPSSKVPGEPMPEPLADSLHIHAESTLLAGAAYIRGHPATGGTLQVNIDSVNGSGAPAYTWTRATSPAETGTPIPGAAGDSYTVREGDSGMYIAAEVTRDDKDGFITTPPVWIHRPSGADQEVLLEGQPLVYKTLRANTSAAAGSRFRYVWKRGDTPDAAGTAIPGATNSSYRLTPEDWGMYITVTVNAPELAGQLSSPPAGKVADVLDIWTTAGSTVFGRRAIHDIIYGAGTSGPRFVAGGDQGAIAWSTDGVVWNAAGDSTFGTSAVLKFGFGKTPDGKPLFVAGGWDGKMAVSTDGVAWKAVESTLDDWITAIAFGEIGGKTMFIAAQYNGAMASSPDGLTWTSMSGLNGQLRNSTGIIDACLVYGYPKGGGAFIAGGTDYRAGIWRLGAGGGEWRRVYTGLYGDKSWQNYFEHTIVTAAWGEINGEGVFVAAGYDNVKDTSHPYYYDTWGKQRKPFMVSSKDGITWKQASTEIFVDTQDDMSHSDVCSTAYGKVAGAGRFINVDYYGGRMAYSQDAAIWRPVAAPGIPAGENSIRAVTYGSPAAGIDIFVAVGAHGKIAYTKFLAD
jgi:hypothetical protein